MFLPNKMCACVHARMCVRIWLWFSYEPHCECIQRAPMHMLVASDFMTSHATSVHTHCAHNSRKKTASPNRRTLYSFHFSICFMQQQQQKIFVVIVVVVDVSGCVCVRAFECTRQTTSSVYSQTFWLLFFFFSFSFAFHLFFKDKIHRLRYCRCTFCRRFQQMHNRLVEWRSIEEKKEERKHEKKEKNYAKLPNAKNERCTKRIE